MFPEREASSQHSLPGTGRYYFVLHLNFFSTYTELVPKKMSSLAVVFAEAEPDLGSEPKRAINPCYQELVPQYSQLAWSGGENTTNCCVWWELSCHSVVEMETPQGSRLAG